jgi:nucleotide-binding universal stress UspA family protein
MRKAENLDIVAIKPNTDLEEELVEGIEISDYLSEHGVKTEYFTLRMSDDERRVADTLLRHVKERGRDLIIIGGYSHSRLREIVLGGMTRDLIKNSTVPVLLSH